MSENFTENKPVVECSFHTEFDDHIFVAMDAELVLFLHDLVTSFVKEKDKGIVAKHWYSQHQLIRPKLHVDFRSNLVGVEFKVAFNMGSQWNVSRGNGRIKWVGWINQCWLFYYNISNGKNTKKQQIKCWTIFHDFTDWYIHVPGM